MSLDQLCLLEHVPANITDLKTNFYQVNDIGFGGIVISDRFSATICYPTANDCQSYENELFGQDAHNMTTGDFNGDGYEDFAVAWAHATAKSSYPSPLKSPVVIL